MEQILLRHHQSHFHQAHGTPFTVDPLQSFFGLSTESPNSVKFRNHQIDPSTIPLPEKEITDFLHVLCPSPMDPPPLDVNITMENIKHGFRLWRETTSTSPKGRKLSLYKMWLDEPGTDTIMSGNEFFTVILDLILLAQRLQVPLSRWKTVHNLFILKKPNDYRPERLRALHQIDAELNLIRRELIAKRLIRHAEEYQYLKDHNYGGRNGKCANDVVMKKYLTLQIWHLQRHNGALTDCDAKSCYDRIIPILLYLSYSKAGLLHSMYLWLCQCLINMEYHIVTAYSASSDTSTSSDTHPLYGIGQGATDAPSGWLLVSTILSRYYDSKAIGCTLVDPTGYFTLRWTHVMFVDDTYLIHSTGDPKASLSTIEQVVQHDSSTWNMGLHITGGKLEGSKSKYLVLIWTFLQNGIPALETHDNNNNPVQLHLYNQSQEQLKRIRHDINDDLFKSLGTYISGSLSDRYEYQVAQTKVQTFKKFLLSCPLTCRETRIACNQYLIPSVLYGAIVQSFDIESCEKIHRSLLPTLLPKLKFPRTFPRPLVFGPIESGGIGLHDFNAHLLSTKIQYIIKDIRAATEIGSLLLITLQWAQLQSGIGQPILQWTGPLPYLESSWLRHIRDGLWQISGAIYIPNLRVEPLQRKNDAYIMEALLQDQSLTQM